MWNEPWDDRPPEPDFWDRPDPWDMPGGDPWDVPGGDPWDNMQPELYDINNPDAVDFDPFHDVKHDIEVERYDYGEDRWSYMEDHKEVEHSSNGEDRYLWEKVLEDSDANESDNTTFEL